MRKLYKNSHIFYGNLRGKANSSLISYQNYNTVMLILRKIDELFIKIPFSHGYFVVKLRKMAQFYIVYLTIRAGFEKIVHKS